MNYAALSSAQDRSHASIHPVGASAASVAEIEMSIAHLAKPNVERVSGGYVKKIVLPTMEGLCFEKVKHITHLEASGNYTLLHFIDNRQVLVCRSLCDIEAQLPQDAFIRVHRSHTIHLRHIKKYVRGKGGHVVLQNGANVPVSSGQKEHFLNTLEQYYR